MYMQFHGMGKHFIIMMLLCTRWCGDFTSSSYPGNKVSMLFLKFTYAIMHSCVNNSHNKSACPSVQSHESQSYD